MYWNDNKTKNEKVSLFLESNFVEINILFVFVLIYSNGDGNAKRFKAWNYYLQIGLFKNYNVIIIRKNSYDQYIGSDIKRYKEIRNLTAGQGYIKGCLLNFECIKNHYRLIAVYFSTQKLVADPKAIKQIDLVG